MPDRVLIAVDRKEAEWFTTPGNEGSTAASKYVRYAVRAALDRDREASDRALAEMYAEVRKKPKEGTISEAIKCHSQACGLVAYAFDVHPDSVARAVAAIERTDQEEGEAA